MEESPPRPRPLDRPLVVGLVGGLVFFLLAATWSIASPLMSAPDEAAHTVKAVSVAEGNLRGDDRETTIAGPPWVDGTETGFTIDAAYAAVGELNACYVNVKEQPAGCAPDPSTATGTAAATTYVGTYPPLYYALVGWPSRFFEPSVGLWLMRFCSAAVGGVLAGLALVGARRTDGGGVVVAGLLLALTPMALYLSSVINPSGMEVMAAAALWASALALVRPSGPTTGGDVVRTAVAFCLLAGIRGFSPLLAVGIVACVVAIAMRRSDLARLRRAPLAAPTAVVTAVVLAVSLAYVVWSKAYAAVSGVRVEDLTFGEALRTSFNQFWWRMRQMVGDFGYLEAALPVAVVAVWGALVGVLGLAALVAGTWRRRIVLVALVVATVLFTTVPESINAAKFGYIWQGRYTMPVAVGVPILAAWCLGHAAWWRQRFVTPVLAVVAVVWVGGQFMGVATTLHRFTLGLDDDFWAFFVRTAWQPLLRTWAVAGLAAGTAVVFAGWAVWMGRRASASMAAATPAPTDEVTGPAAVSPT